MNREEKFDQWLERLYRRNPVAYLLVVVGIAVLVAACVAALVWKVAHYG